MSVDPPVRLAEAADFTTISSLNDAAVPAVSDVPQIELERLAAIGTCLVIDAAGPTGLSVAAFLILLGPGADYASPNYRFFVERHADFLYVDRIVVASHVRSAGFGARLYDAAAARPGAPVLCAEVNIRPRNEGSLRFHDRQGFQSVGEQDTEGGTKRVVMLEKPLT